MLRFRHVTLAVACLACRAPTEIVIEVSTDVPCSVVASHHVSIRLGPADTLATEANASNVVQADGCSGGVVGSLVATPSGAKDDLVGIAVVLGVTSPTTDCDTDASGCIVARRSVRYNPGTPLHLPIVLRADCTGTTCGVTETCEHNRCVPDVVSSCDAGVCGEPGNDGGGACPLPPLTTNMPTPTLAWHFDDGPGTTTREANDVLPPVAVPATAWINGPSGCGGAIHFDGTFAVVLGDHSVLQAASGMTVALRVRSTAPNGVIIERVEAKSYGFDLVGNCVTLYSPLLPGDAECPVNAYADGAWHEVSLSFTGNGTQNAAVRMRVEGVGDIPFTAQTTYSPAGPGVSLTIPQSFVGDIDDVLVFDQPL